MTSLLCDPDWYVHKPDVQNKWDENNTQTPHTHTHISTRIFIEESITKGGFLRVEFQYFVKLTDQCIIRGHEEKRYYRIDNIRGELHVLGKFTSRGHSM